MDFKKQKITLKLVLDLAFNTNNVPDGIIVR